MADDQWLDGVLRREKDAWRALVEQFSGQMMGWCLRGRIPAAEAEELVQEVFLRAYAKIETYDPQKSPIKTWLFGILRHAAIDRGRRISRDSLLIEVLRQHGASRAYEEIGERLVEPDTLECLHACMQELPPVDRKVIELRYFDQLDYASIRQRLSDEDDEQRTEQAIRGLAGRALAKLAALVVERGC